MNQNPLVELHKYGQSFWLDNINRPLITSGELKRLVEADGLRGVTSNPTIFEKAITESDAYDEEFAQAVKESESFAVASVTAALTTSDIKQGCDILRPVFDESEGQDGYVCLEVSPDLAHDTAGTIKEAVELHERVNRKNLMIKVPATPAGIPVIEELINRGVCVNVTLMFSFEVYEQVAEAYLKGLEKRVMRGESIREIASVASIFVSRVDTKIDKLLDAKINEAKDETQKLKLRALIGKTAIANAKTMYEKYLELFGDENERWSKLKEKEANPQRLLWASTSTKNPDFPDTYYVEALIGKDTVDTMPPATVEAFRDHGKVAATLENGFAEARETLKQITAAGIDLNEAMKELQTEGVAGFVKSFENLTAALVKKHKELAGAAEAMKN
ncbi:MAG: transaldolase [Acidobacteriota bacterium]|nr:transaldolase [Acidobacteriota bacterium]